MAEVMEATCDLHCSVAEVRETEKGVEVDMRCDVYAAEGQKLLWSGLSTLLSRNQRTRTRIRSVKHSEPFFGLNGMSSYWTYYLRRQDVAFVSMSIKARSGQKRHDYTCSS